jgi:hypothetical protein
MRLRPSVDAAPPERAAAIHVVLNRFGADALRITANAGIRGLCARAHR